MATDERSSVVFLIDVDNTLLDNDRIQSDFKRHLERELGAAARDRYWAIFDDRFARLGYVDYLGALQQLREENPRDMRLMHQYPCFLDYPFAEALYPRALDVVRHLRETATTVVLSDGDTVFQPRKVDRSGIREAAGGHVLIYIHKEKELADLEQRYPAKHYVLIDDKPRILAAVKQSWGKRVTTVLPMQGRYAKAGPKSEDDPPADVTIDRVADLLEWDLALLWH